MGTTYPTTTIAVLISEDDICEKRQWNLFCLDFFGDDLFDCIESFTIAAKCYKDFCADFSICLIVETIAEIDSVSFDTTLPPSIPPR